MTIWSICLLFFVATTFGATGYVLCIGDDGHIEFETLCLPASCETAEDCELGVSENAHDEHSGCSDCTDVDSNKPLLSKRIQRIDFNEASQSTLTSAICTCLNQISAKNNDSYKNQNSLAYGLSPPSNSISTTVPIT